MTTLTPHLVGVLPDHVRGEVVGDVGGEEGVDAGVLLQQVLGEVVGEGGVPPVEPLPVHGAPATRQLNNMQEYAGSWFLSILRMIQK